MTAYLHLLGKHCDNPASPPQEVTLVDHTRRVCEMAQRLGESLGPKMLKTFGLSEKHLDPWLQAVWLTAWIHDWGKANDHFQRKVRGDKSFRQGVRHEAVSLYLMLMYQDYLLPIWENLPTWTKCGVASAVLGHHLKYPDPIQDRASGKISSMIP